MDGCQSSSCRTFPRRICYTHHMVLGYDSTPRVCDPIVIMILRPKSLWRGLSSQPPGWASIDPRSLILFSSSLLSIFPVDNGNDSSMYQPSIVLSTGVTIFGNIVSVIPTESYLVLLRSIGIESGSDKLSRYRCKFRILKIMTDWLWLIGWT